VRLGTAAGLNALAGSPMRREELLTLVADLEGHPDNAAPAVLGGLVVSAGSERVRAIPDPRLRFILMIPDRELSTDEARRVVPRSYSRADAVHNLSRACLLTAALLTRAESPLWTAVDDRFHQPYRARLFRPLYPVLRAAREGGALAGWLSGSGSTICLLARGETGKIIRRMRQRVPATRSWAVKVVGVNTTGYKVCD
jgi:homoserine kinase